MTTREVLAALKQRGVFLTVWELRGLIDRDRVPRPRLNTSLQYDWTDADVDHVIAAASREAAPCN